jgi:WD40 repeat protein
LTREPCIVWSPDGKLIAVRGADAVILMNARDGGVVHQWAAECAIAISPDSGIVATSTAQGQISLWDAETGMQIAALDGHSDTIIVLRFSPDGTMLASSSLDGTLVIWDLTNVR